MKELIYIIFTFHTLNAWALLRQAPDICVKRRAVSGPMTKVVKLCDDYSSFDLRRFLVGSIDWIQRNRPFEAAL